MERNIKCNVFTCKKCGHKLYKPDTPYFIYLLAGLVSLECPDCGESSRENWDLTVETVPIIVENCDPEVQKELNKIIEIQKA